MSGQTFTCSSNGQVVGQHARTCLPRPVLKRLKDCQHVEFVRRAYGNANRKYPDYTKSRAVDDNGIVLLFTASCDRLDISSSLTLRKQDLIYLLTYGQVLQRGDPL